MRTIVFIPGAGGGGPKSWEPQVTALQGEMNCIVIDHRHLDNIGIMAQNVLDIAPQTFTLCGTSMGGYVALEIARRAPERIEALMLANTTARADNEERKAGRLERIAAGPEAYYAGLDDIRNYSDGVAPAHIGDKRLIGFLKEMAIEAGFDCFVRHQYACMNRRPSLDILPHLRMPVLIWGGREDKVIPTENQKEIAALVPHSQLVIFDDTAHVTHLENPEGVNVLIRGFLRECALADKECAA